MLVDSFTRADANALGTAETGQTWSETSSPATTDKFGIRSGKARVIPQTVNYYFWAWCPSGQSDVRVKVRLTVGTVIGTPPGTGVGILFRVNSTGSGLLLRYVGGTTNNWRWSRSAGSISDYAGVTGPVLTQGQTYDLEVRANGSNCTAFVDGVQIGGTQTITDYQTNTYHGLHVFQSTDHLFENFSVLAEADAEPVGWLGEPGYYTEAAVMRRLEYVRARWYQAGGPGWLSQDPLGLRGGDLNLYRYAGNSPLVETDPGGLAAAPPGVTMRNVNCSPSELAQARLKANLELSDYEKKYLRYVECIKDPQGNIGLKACYKTCDDLGVCTVPECVRQTDATIRHWRFGNEVDAFKGRGLGRNCSIDYETQKRIMSPRTGEETILCVGHGDHWEIKCKGKKLYFPLSWAAVSGLGAGRCA